MFMKEIPNDILEKISTAINSDGYFITISHREVGEAKDLKHYWKRSDYPTDLVEGTFNQLVRSFCEKHGALG